MTAHPSLDVIGILFAVAHASWPGCYSLHDVAPSERRAFLAYLDTLDQVVELFAPSFICDNCGGRFARNPDDEAVHAEALENFGVRGDAPGMAIVCDGCYREIMKRIRG